MKGAERKFHENCFIVNPLDNPTEWHVSNLPDFMLTELKQQIQNKLNQSDPKYALYNSLNLMLNYVSMPFNKNIQATFDQLEKIDLRRNTDSSKIFTELYKLKEGN